MGDERRENAFLMFLEWIGVLGLAIELVGAAQHEHRTALVSAGAAIVVVAAATFFGYRLWHEV